MTETAQKPAGELESLDDVALAERMKANRDRILREDFYLPG